MRRRMRLTLHAVVIAVGQLFHCTVVELMTPLLPTVTAIVVAWLTVVDPTFDVPVTVIV